jgi:diguanylate cyclase (GGDEF)-like protein
MAFVVPDSEPPDEETAHNRKSFVPREELVSSHRNRPCLVVMAGPTVGEVHRLKLGETIVGRSRAAAMRFDEEGVSRSHVRLVVERGRVLVEDMRSANGTFVNGAEIKGSVVLEDGDRIEIGVATLLKFTYADTAEETFQRQMYNAALRDALTGTFNRTYLMQRLENELAFALRHGSSLGLITFDVDLLRKVNDLHGHATGDLVLTQIVRRVQWAVRTEDVLARHSGGEFCVICRGIPFVGVMQLAERLRAVVQSQKFELGGKSVYVTISLGVATLPEIRVTKPAELIAAASTALAQAKQAGRNRVHQTSPDFDDEPPTMRASQLPIPSRPPR